MYLSDKIESIVIKSNTKEIVRIDNYIRTTRGYLVNVTWKYMESLPINQYLNGILNVYSIIVKDEDDNHVALIEQDKITTAPCYQTIVNYKKKDEDVINPHLILNDLKDDSKFYYSMRGGETEPVSHVNMECNTDMNSLRW